MNRWLALSLVAAVLNLSGCAAMVKYHSPSLIDQPTASTQTIRSLGFFWGLVPPNKISLEQCGAQGIQRMKVRQGWIDGLITYATMGVVISYKVKIWCPAGPKDG